MKGVRNLVYSYTHISRECLVGLNARRRASDADAEACERGAGCGVSASRRHNYEPDPRDRSANRGTRRPAPQQKKLRTDDWPAPPQTVSSTHTLKLAAGSSAKTGARACGRNVSALG